MVEGATPPGGPTPDARTAEPPTVWCPSCGAEYRAGTVRCAQCRVELVTEKPRPFTDSSDEGDEGDEDALVELGEWPKLQAQILRRRLESAGIPVMIEWSGTPTDATGILVVPEENGDFAWAVVNEIDVEEEVPDTSPHAYVARIEEHLSAAADLLDELRTRLDELEAEGRDAG
jgi:hypothetical protein